MSAREGHRDVGGGQQGAHRGEGGQEVVAAVLFFRVLHLTGVDHDVADGGESGLGGLRGLGLRRLRLLHLGGDGGDGGLRQGVLFFAAAPRNQNNQEEQRQRGSAQNDPVANHALALELHPPQTPGFQKLLIAFIGLIGHGDPSLNYNYLALSYTKITGNTRGNTVKEINTWRNAGIVLYFPRIIASHSAEKCKTGG